MAPTGPKTHTAVYAGSFDPITRGHLDVLSRARLLFDEIVLAIGDNPDKPALFTFEERVEMAPSRQDSASTVLPPRSPLFEAMPSLDKDRFKRED